METLVYALALFILIAIIVQKGGVSLVLKALDNRAQKISDEIERSKELRHEAQNLLKTYQRDLAVAEKDKVQIAERAKKEASEYIDKRHEIINRAVNNQVRIGRERVAQTELRAKRYWRGRILDLAVQSASDVIKQSAGSHHAKATDESIDLISNNVVNK